MVFRSARCDPHTREWDPRTLVRPSSSLDIQSLGEATVHSFVETPGTWYVPPDSRPMTSMDLVHRRRHRPHPPLYVGPDSLRSPSTISRPVPIRVTPASTVSVPDYRGIWGVSIVTTVLYLGSTDIPSVLRPVPFTQGRVSLLSPTRASPFSCVGAGSVEVGVFSGVTFNRQFWRWCGGNNSTFSENPS